MMIPLHNLIDFEIRWRSALRNRKWNPLLSFRNCHFLYKGVQGKASLQKGHQVEIVPSTIEAILLIRELTAQVVQYQ